MDIDYTFVFSDVAPPATKIQMIDHRRAAPSYFWLEMDDEQLARAGHMALPSHLADMIDLAIAVYVADRMAIRHGDMRCWIHVVIPLRQPDLLKTKIAQRLADVLYWFSDDRWSFEFPLRRKSGRPAEAQIALPEIEPLDPDTEVALWSGGLDSLAGLKNRLIAQPTRPYTLFGTGDNSFICSVQSRLATVIRNQSCSKVKLVQLTWKTETATRTPRNSIARARGFTFLLLGAVCATLQGQNLLNIYENGVGAINLPNQPSEIGIDHSRSVHPRSLLMMSDLLSVWLNKPFQFQNPFIFWTKAELSAALTDTGDGSLIAQSVSCDSRRRQPGSPTQCGFCSSCLLRRQALLASGRVDATHYAVVAARAKGKRFSPIAGNYLRATLYQVIKLRSLLTSNNPSEALVTAYEEELSGLVDEMGKKQNGNPNQLATSLTNLYKRYVIEWEQVWCAIARDLLSDNELRFVQSSMQSL